MRRGVRRGGAAIAAVLLLCLTPAPAGAHTMPSSAVLLDINASTVGGQIEMPIGRLALALNRTLTPAAVLGPYRVDLERYVRQHLSATSGNGRRWAVAVDDPRVQQVNGIPNLVMSLTLTPPGGRVTPFTLHYDVIINQLITHRAIALIRTQWNKGTTRRNPVVLGVFDWNHSSLKVNPTGGSWLDGFLSMWNLGVHHIRTGPDHLLFLLTLLIPAPLIARGRRWRRRDDPRRSALRVVHVVSAFAVGHSITLALATFGVVHPPSQIIESLIALSILVSAIHALRPLVPGGEAVIAVGFGLVHGLAFATMLGDLGLSGGALVSSLLAFNLGIESTQLLVVALMMPSLFLLSRTAIYGLIRVTAALFGIVVSVGWLLERTGLISSDPFAAASSAVIAHPFDVPAIFALLAILAHSGVLPRCARTDPSVADEAKPAALHA